VHGFLRKTLIAGGAMLISWAAVAVAADGPGDAAPTDAGSADASLGSALVARLQALRPDIPVERVSPTPLPGIVALELGGGTIFYGTSDGRFLFAGDLYELTDTDLVDVAEAGRVAKRRELIAKADPAGMVIFRAAGTPKAVINVFTDVDCGYCQKLHREVPELNAMGIEVRYLGYPRAGIGSESYDRIVSAWCAEDPNDALTRVKAGEQIPAATCDNEVAAHYGLGRQIGIAGTPAIVLSDGRLLPGYLPAKELGQTLGVAADQP
jgi:thiol:disulfide interchange protein DsbC